MFPECINIVKIRIANKSNDVCKLACQSKSALADLRSDSHEQRNCSHFIGVHEF